MWKEITIKTREQLMAEGWKNDEPFAVNGLTGMTNHDLDLAVLGYQTKYFGWTIKVNFNKDGSFIFQESWYPSDLIEGVDKIEQVVNKMRKEIGLKRGKTEEEEFESQDAELEFDLEYEIERVTYNKGL